MTDHAAAVEAVRERHTKVEQHGAGCSWCSIHRGGTRDNYGPTLGEQAHADRATLLRAYEAVVPVLDAALAWEEAYDAYGNVDGPFNMDRAEEALYQAIRAYRAAKGGT